MIRIGTSGWHYDHWQGPFYPEELSDEDFLAYYAARFDTVEINHSFYQLPEEEKLIRWRETVPDDFCFAVKASRYITHMKKLKDPQEPLATFYARIEVLGETCGPILFQLPPNWRFNAERLDHFLAALSDAHQHVFELRDPSWLNEQTYEMLEAHGAAFCIYEWGDRLAPNEVTADVVYVRLHGPSATPYQGGYSTETLSGWAGALSSWSREARDVYCFFDNDEAGYAPRNAYALQQMMA